ncbi:MAG TPA: Rieske (2Fe-2S) protein [Candidatus Limnocylindrales bacterium]|nr:Rieske (2Fe-2S) protein [Candidatus Limnocylindrales bacterium]
MTGGSPGRPPGPSPRERRIERLVLAAFGVTLLSGLALLGLYVLGGQTQLEGVLLTLCLGGLGLGIVLWAQELMPTRIHVEPRDPLATGEQAPESLREAFLEEAGFSRRTLLLRALAGAVAGLAAALAIPVFSLGPAPGRALRETGWRAGLRLVGLDGAPIRADDVPLGGVVTVFPEGEPGRADSQTLLIRVEPELLRLPPDRRDWAPDGYIAYSKICTHAGCPVGLYRASQHALICPCHQSTFDVLDGARPTFGPAVRPLPQLPITRQPDGTFVARGDYPEPVGPSFWDMAL